MGRQMGVRFGIPLIVVYSVDNPIEVIFSSTQYSIEAVTEFWRLYLFAILFAHRVQYIRKDNPGFEKIDLAEELDKVRSEILPTYVEQVHIMMPEEPLVSEIVNGEQGADIPEQ